MSITTETIDYALLDLTKKEKEGFYMEEETQKIKTDILTLEIFLRAKEYNIEHRKAFLLEVEKAKERLGIWRSLF